MADTDVLVMTYSNMKPLDAEAHRHIADWVKKGGRLLFVGSDRDPFQNVREWWTTGGNSYTAASQHLFEQLGLDRNAGEGSYKVGKGEVRVMRNDPKEHILTEGGDKDYMGSIADLYGKKKGMELKNNFLLHRGHYVVAAVMDESVSDAPLTMKGRYIDLFDPELPIVEDVTLNPGTQALLIDLGKVEEKKTPKVLAASFRESDEKVTPQSYSFTAKSPVDTDGIARVALPKRPKSVKIDGVESLESSRWNPESKTYLIAFDNKPEGRNVSITY